MSERHCPACGAVFGDDRLFCGVCGALLAEGDHGPVLGGYEILERIAEGGMGAVHRARRTADGAIAAVKLMKGAEGARALLRFAREARTLQRLDHPGIVRLIEVLPHPHTPGLVMELLTGCTLKDLLRARGRLEAEEAAWVGLRVLDALAHAHAQGIVHRDLKPSNVFLTDNGVLKLLDFGLAKAPGDRDLTHTGVALGAFLYTPPEQIRGERPSPATDLYAFGCVLFEMLAGRPPFVPESGGDFALMEMHLHSPPPRLADLAPGVPARLAALVEALLAKDPGARPATGAVSGMLREAVPSPRPPALPEGVRHPSELLSSTQDPREQTGSRTEELAPGTLYWTLTDALHRPAPPARLLLDPPALAKDALARAREWAASVPKPPAALGALWKRSATEPVPAQALADALGEAPESERAMRDLARAWGVERLPLPAAVARIGAPNVLDLLLVQAMLPPAPPGRAAALRAVALHLLAIGWLARALAGAGAAVNEGAAGALGLAHDLGKLPIVALADDDDWEGMQARMLRESGLAAEWETFGFSHLDLGMLVAVGADAPQPARRWLFYHHHPEAVPVGSWPVEAQPLLLLVHVAHLVLQELVAEGKPPFDRLAASPWARRRRPHRPDHERLLRHPLALPLSDARFHAGLVQDAARVLARADEALRV